MIDPKTLLPEVQKLLPGVSPQEIMDGIKQFIQAHPNATNQDAITALTLYLQQNKQTTPPQGKPFENLVSQIGAR